MKFSAAFAHSLVFGTAVIFNTGNVVQSSKLRGLQSPLLEDADEEYGENKFLNLPTCIGGDDGCACVFDSDCNSGFCSVQLVCKQKLGPGERCLENDDCRSNDCSLAFFCNECDALRFPDFGDSDCESGRCELGLGGFATCQPKEPDGELCNRNSDCISDACYPNCLTGEPAFDLCLPRCTSTANRDPTFLISLLMDTYTALLTKLVPEKIIKQNANAPTDIDVTENIIGWGRVGRAQITDLQPSDPGFYEGYSKASDQLDRKIKNFTKFSIDILSDDGISLFEKIFEKFQETFLLSGLADGLRSLEQIDQQSFPSPIEMDNIFSETKLYTSRAVSPTYTTNFTMLSDESFSRIFFFGMGSILMAEQPQGDNVTAPQSQTTDLGPYLVDIPIQNFAVRNGFRPLGAAIYFDANQTVSAIWDYHTATLYRPGDTNWEYAKFLARSTAFTYLTARNHLIWSHMLVSNVVTRNTIIELPPPHPIRRLLTVFEFGANAVNADAFYSLIPERSALHRAVGWTYDALSSMFDTFFEDSTIFEPFGKRTFSPALQALSDAGRFPYISEGVAYYNIVEDFVRQWLVQSGELAIDEYALTFYNKIREESIGQAYEIPPYINVDSMIDLLSQFIFVVTAYHELVGHVVDYNYDPDSKRIAVRLNNQNRAQGDLQSQLLINVVAASTSQKMPQLVGSYPNFFAQNGAPEWERTIWDDFQAKLQAQSLAVQAADAARIAANPNHEFKYFDPDRMESSISV